MRPTTRGLLDLFPEELFSWIFDREGRNEKWEGQPTMDIDNPRGRVQIGEYEENPYIYTLYH